MNLHREFAGISAAGQREDDRLFFAVRAVPHYEGCFVGKDPAGKACLLIASRERSDRPRPSIRLETLCAQFDVPCRVRTADGLARQDRFTLVQCCASDIETTRYFLSACESIIRLIGPAPPPTEVAAAINRLAAMFRALRRAPTRSLNGLFGELFLIWSSANVPHAVEAWRLDDTARFDFSWGSARLDVKVATGRTRAHVCSFEQCNPPDGTAAIVASLFVERIAGGLSLSDLVASIEAALVNEPPLLVKVREVIGATLGTTFLNAMEERFDIALAQSSLRFFDLRAVPRLHDPLPPGVSDAHFRSDFSLAEPLAPESLGDLEPALRPFFRRT